MKEFQNPFSKGIEANLVCFFSSGSSPKAPPQAKPPTPQEAAASLEAGRPQRRRRGRRSTILSEGNDAGLTGDLDVSSILGG